MTPPLVPSRGRRGWDRLEAGYPDIARAYEALRDTCTRGPLTGRLSALVKLAVSVGAKAERTIHAHTRKALDEGLGPDELRQVALVALPTIGLPGALEALKRIDQSIEEAGRDGHTRPPRVPGRRPAAGAARSRPRRRVR